MKTCPICQQAYSDDVEFCARDGARLAAEAREERECPYCAERILKKARVCSIAATMWSHWPGPTLPFKLRYLLRQKELVNPRLHSRKGARP